MEKEHQVPVVLGQLNSSDEIVLDSDPSGLSKYDADEFIDMEIEDVSYLILGCSYCFVDIKRRIWGIDDT